MVSENKVVSENEMLRKVEQTMRQTFLRRGLIAALGLAALLFTTLGTQPTTTASAADIFSNVGCAYADYSCLYMRNGNNTAFTPTYGYPTALFPSYNTYPYSYGFNNSLTYTPAFYGYGFNNSGFNNFGFNNFGFNNSFYGYPYGGVPNRFFTAVGCNVGNYTCLRNKLR